MAMTPAERLEDARDQLHLLRTGQGVAELKDSNGETIKYSKADIAALINYVAELQAEIDGTPLRNVNPPMGFYF